MVYIWLTIVGNDWARKSVPELSHSSLKQLFEDRQLLLLIKPPWVPLPQLDEHHKFHPINDVVEFSKPEFLINWIDGLALSITDISSKYKLRKRLPCIPNTIVDMEFIAV